MKRRTQGHTNTSMSSDTRADWSGAFALVPSLQIAYVWHASVFTREVLDGLLRIGFLYPQQIIWNKGRTVLTRSLYWFQHEPCWFVRKKNAPWYGKAGENSTVWDSPSPKFIMGGSKEEKCDHPTQKPLELMRRPILNHTKRGESVYDPFIGSGTTMMAAEVTGASLSRYRHRSEVHGCCGSQMAAVHRPGSHARRRRSDVRSDQGRKARSRGMNGAMPPRDRGNRVADCFRAHRHGGVVPGALGLECRTALTRKGAVNYGAA